MIIKTIAADRQLAEGIREESLTSEVATLKPVEKSYLRSQFERRQKRQIELTNKMHRNRPSGEGAQPERLERRHQHQQQQRQTLMRDEQPDLAVRSHELIKRRFFEELERRESINSARVAATHKQAKLHQQPEHAPTGPVASSAHRPHHNQQHTQFRAESEPPERSSDVKADINEPDGAGTDADEATSLETIITNNPKSSIAAPTTGVAASSLYEQPAGALSRPPLDNSVAPPPVRQVESDEGTSDDHEDVGASTRFSELAWPETDQLQAGSSSLRRASKAASADLQDGAQPSSDCEQEPGHEIMLHRSIPLKQQQQHRPKEQYANPRSFDDSARGGRGGESRAGNNVNHDQHDGGHHETTLKSSSTSQVQEFAGMRLERCDEGGKEGREGINLLESGCGEGRLSSTSGHDLVGSPNEQQQQQVPQPNLKPADASQAQDQSQFVQEASQMMARNDTELAEAAAGRPAGGGGASFLATAPAAIEGAQEEDARSSCSSSGFGASVSAGSSAASSSSEGRGGHHRNRHHLHIERRSQADDAVNGHDDDDDHPRRSQVVAAAAGLSADEIAQFEIVVGGLDANNAGEQTLSVGVERNRDDEEDDEDAHCEMVHVENHGYGSLESGQADRGSAARMTRTTRNQTDKRRWPLVNPEDLSNELDLYLSRQYVNLPADDHHCEPCPVGANAGYATVRARTNPAGDTGGEPAAGRGQTSSNVSLANSSRQPTEANNGGGSAGRNPDGSLINSRHYSPLRPTAAQPRDGTDDCASEHNSSTSSSGGFSKLPPVRLIDHNFANNSESSSPSTIGRAPQLTAAAALRPLEEIQSNSLEPQSTAGRKSLLRRFGSLVSRAFTSANLSNGGEFGGSAHNPNRGQGGAHLNGPADSNQQRRRLGLSVEIPSGGGPHSNEGISHRVGIPSLREHKSMDLASERGRETTTQSGGHHDHIGSNRSQGQASAPTSRELKVAAAAAATYSTRSLAVAEADLVILSGKHSLDHQQAARAAKRPVTMTSAEIHHPHHRQRHGSRSGRRLDEAALVRGGRQVRERSATTGEKCCSSRSARHHTNARSNKAHEFTERFSARRSTTSSCSSFTSLDDSSTSSSVRNSCHRDAERASTKRPHASKLRRASSLSDELESLISPSEVGSSQRNYDEPDFGRGKCDSAARVEHDDKLGGGGSHSKTHPFRMRWFGANGSSGGCSSPNDDSTGSSGSHHQFEPQSWASSGRKLRGASRHQLRSLIDHNHASGGDHKQNAQSAAGNTKPDSLTNLPQGLKVGRGQRPTSLVYTSLSLAGGCSPHSLDKEAKYQRRGGQLCMQPDGETCDSIDNGGDGEAHHDELVVTDGKCQSLNLYQNLLRNYVKRRSHHQHHRHHHHHRGHNHNHSHHHHHHHHHRHSGGHHRSSSSRHAHCSSSATRCGQRCSSPGCEQANDLQLPAKASPSSGKGRDAANHQAGVWGQLIKIKKSDGSQVVELQRAPDRSWGFFVARGAINNTKGIFISRMHNSSTGNSLSGLLSVGDRILSIDNYAIEPDFDILRVNQMISKKSKIHLEVKPFKG